MTLKRFLAFINLEVMLPENEFEKLDRKVERKFSSAEKEGRYEQKTAYVTKLYNNFQETWFIQF